MFIYDDDDDDDIRPGGVICGAGRDSGTKAGQEWVVSRQAGGATAYLPTILHLYLPSTVQRSLPCLTFHTIVIHDMKADCTF